MQKHKNTTDHCLKVIPRRLDRKIKRNGYVKNKEDRDPEFTTKRTKQISTECDAYEKA